MVNGKINNQATSFIKSFNSILPRLGTLVLAAIISAICFATYILIPIALFLTVIIMIEGMGAIESTKSSFYFTLRHLGNTIILVVVTIVAWVIFEYSFAAFGFPGAITGVILGWLAIGFLSVTSLVLYLTSGIHFKGGTGGTGPGIGSPLIAQFLVPDEQLLFSSEKAEIKDHWGKGEQLARSLDDPERRQRPKVRIGELAITDRRIYLVRMEGGLFSEQHPVRSFEVIYDVNYARQRIELAKAKNAEIRQQAKGVGLFSRGRFMRKQGLETLVNVAIGASLEKAVLGQDYIKLKLHRVWVGGKPPGLGLAEALATGTHITKQEYELRIKQPVSTLTQVGAVALTLTTTWFGAILAHYKSKANVTYEPILEIFQAKASELSALVKELGAIAE
jgi:hypothetical protein